MCFGSNVAIVALSTTCTLSEIVILNHRGLVRLLTKLTWVNIGLGKGFLSDITKLLLELNQCWPIIKSVLWHCPESNATICAHEFSAKYVFGDYTFKIITISLRVQCVDIEHFDHHLIIKEPIYLQWIAFGKYMSDTHKVPIWTIYMVDFRWVMHWDIKTLRTPFINIYIKFLYSELPVRSLLALSHGKQIGR